MIISNRAASGVDQFDAEVDCVAGDGAASSRLRCAAAAQSNASCSNSTRSLGSSASLAACMALHANDLKRSAVLMMAFPLSRFRLTLSQLKPAHSQNVLRLRLGGELA